MARQYDRPMLRDPDEVSREQYPGFPIWQNARRELYKYAPSGIDIWEKALIDLDPHPEACIADAGCGDGMSAMKLADRGHQGPIYGFDMQPNNYLVANQIAEERGHENITFHQSDIRNLRINGERIPDGFFDVVRAEFVLYHITDPMSALEELVRVAKPGGKVQASSRSVRNQSRLWEFADNIARDLGIEAPEPFYANFDIEMAEYGLEAICGSVYAKYTQEEPLHIPAEGWIDYKMAQLSLMPSCRPAPRASVYQNAIDRLVKPQFDAEVAQRGYFTDYVSQGYFICIKK